MKKIFTPGVSKFYQPGNSLMFTSFVNLTENEIKNRLANIPRQGIVNPYPAGVLKDTTRPAAVLIPLLCAVDGWRILFIHRTANQDDPHSGQVAFPGGASELGDVSLEETALRETEEEIGINSSDVRILGRLNDYLTITSYQVTPFVASVPWPHQLKLALDEVSHTFSIPLKWLADPTNHEVKERTLPPPYGSIPVIYFKPYEGEILWGASARFTIGLLEGLFGNYHHP